MATGIRESEELEITRVEKVLMLGLVVFLLIGALWALEHMDNLVPQPVLSRTAYQSEYYGYDGRWAGDRPRESGPPIEDAVGIPPVRARVEKLQHVVNVRRAQLDRANAVVREADRQYQFGREEFRTGIEAAQRTGAQEAAYRRARALYERAIAVRNAAKAALAKAEADLAGPQGQLTALEKKAGQIYSKRTHQRDIILFVLHFAFAGVCFWISWSLWRWGRNTQWRFLTILTALLTASVIQLIFLAFRYCWEIFQGLAQLGVALLGSVGCILAIVALKRYVFNPERLARSRLAGRCCPNCSTRFEPGQAYCWDCGRSLQETCEHCGVNRLRYAPHCGNCGK
ncbi:MAG TPA: zinc ribbon domain-containing protein [Armatimonadota bacterium]|jgi:hypothetical protein